MLANSETIMSLVHEAQVRQATAYSEHLLAARLAARSQPQAETRRDDRWRLWKRLGRSRGRRGN